MAVSAAEMQPRRIDDPLTCAVSAPSNCRLLINSVVTVCRETGSRFLVPRRSPGLSVMKNGGQCRHPAPGSSSLLWVTSRLKFYSRRRATIKAAATWRSQEDKFVALRRQDILPRAHSSRRIQIFKVSSKSSSSHFILRTCPIPSQVPARVPPLTLPR